MGFMCLHPISIPGMNRQWMLEINKKLLHSQIRMAMRMAGWSGDTNPIVFAATPAAGLVLPRMKRKCTIYHLSDKYDKFRDLKIGNRISELDEIVVNEADALVCVSQAITADYLMRTPNCHYISHGVNFELFNKAATEKFPVPSDLELIPGPIIGYFGSITESNDKEILVHLATSHPEWSIVLIGQVVSDYSQLQAYPNIHFLGSKATRRIAGIRSAIQRMHNELGNKRVDTLLQSPQGEGISRDGKAGGFGSDTRGCRCLRECCVYRSDPEQFTRQVELCLDSDTENLRSARIESVRHETWKDKAEQVSVLIESCMSKN